MVNENLKKAMQLDYTISVLDLQGKERTDFYE